MKLMHRGLTIELPADDPRIEAIEVLLFGKSLAPDPAPSAPPPPAVPDVFRKYWNTLDPLQRRELELLAGRRHRAEELERLLGVDQPKLCGMHSSFARLARYQKTQNPVITRGRSRAGRSYLLDEAAVPWVRQIVAESQPPQATS